jgi:hypothetical protein
VSTKTDGLLILAGEEGTESGVKRGFGVECSML